MSASKCSKLEAALLLAQSEGADAGGLKKIANASGLHPVLIERALAAVGAIEIPEPGPEVPAMPGLALASDWALNDPPKPDPIIEGVLDRGDKAALVAQSKQRKSFKAMNLAIHLAAERETPFPWMKRARRCRVLFVNLEIKASHMHARLWRMARSMGIDASEFGDHLTFANWRGANVTPESIEQAAQITEAEVVILDPIYKMHSGDENSAQDVKPMLAAIDRLCETTGAAVLMVHHTTKGRSGDRQAIDRGAGSGVLARDFDAGIFLTPHASEPEAAVVTCVLRNYPPRPPRTIQWQDGHFVESDLPPIEETTQTARRAAARGPAVTDTQIFEVVREHGPLATMELHERLMGLGLSRDGSKATARRMADEGQLDAFREPKMHGATYYGTPHQIRAIKASYQTNGAPPCERPESEAVNL